MIKNNDLQNHENYNLILSNNLFEIYNKYFGIINEFLIHYLNSHDINNEKSKKNLENGLLCINHVFKFLILYTKNLDLTIYHSQRALYFYVEFMEQVNSENHSFLQLTSNDAVLFVYKKTNF